MSARKTGHKSYHLLIMYSPLLTCFQNSHAPTLAERHEVIHSFFIRRDKIKLASSNSHCFYSINKRKQINASTVLAKKRKYTRWVKQRNTHRHINVCTNIINICNRSTTDVGMLCCRGLPIKPHTVLCRTQLVRHFHHTE